MSRPTRPTLVLAAVLSFAPAAGAQQRTPRPAPTPATPPATQPVAPAAAQPVAAQPVAAQPVAAQPTAQPAQTAAQPAAHQWPGLPFRAGQWGLEFGISRLDAYNLAAVRFTSPTRAWILNVHASGDVLRTEYEPAPSDTVFPGPLSPSKAIQQGGSASLTVGRRAYKALGTRAARTLSLGVTGSGNYAERLANGRREWQSSGWHGGLEAELGGIWLVTPSLGLSGSMQLRALYTSDERTYNLGSTQRSRGFTGGLGRGALTASLFF